VDVSTYEVVVTDVDAATYLLQGTVGFIVADGDVDSIDLRLEQEHVLRLIGGSPDAQADVYLFVTDLAAAAERASDGGADVADLELTGRWRQRTFDIDPGLRIVLAQASSRPDWLRTDDLSDTLVYRFDLPDTHVPFNNDTFGAMYGGTDRADDHPR